MDDLLTQASVAAAKVVGRSGEGGPQDHELLAEAVLALIEHLQKREQDNG